MTAESVAGRETVRKRERELRETETTARERQREREKERERGYFIIHTGHNKPGTLG